MVLQVLVDSREPTIIVEQLRQLDMNVTTKQLVLGDYILSDRLVVERKTGTDFAQSLFDNRLFSQVHQMIENFEEVIMILEDYDDPRIIDKSISGALAYLILRRGISVIPSSGHKHTASIIERLASWEQEDKMDPILSRVAAKKMSLEEKREFLIQGLEGVGRKTAQLLLTYFEKPIEVFGAILSSKVEMTKSGNPKRITGPFAKIKGIGPKFILKNQALLWSTN